MAIQCNLNSLHRDPIVFVKFLPSALCHLGHQLLQDGEHVGLGLHPEVALLLGGDLPEDVLALQGVAFQRARAGEPVVVRAILIYKLFPICHLAEKELVYRVHLILGLKQNVADSDLSNFHSHFLDRLIRSRLGPDKGALEWFLNLGLLSRLRYWSWLFRLFFVI